MIWDDGSWECYSCGAWGRGTKEHTHFQDCDVLIFREVIGDVATILIETKERRAAWLSSTEATRSA